jgi:hypothetical protein
MQMKTFKSFLDEAGPNAKPKAKGEADFVDAHSVEITDKEDQATDGSAKVSTKDGSGKRKADRLDNKQAMGEDVGQADARKTAPSSKEAQQKVFDKHKERMKQLAKEEVEQVDELSKKTLDNYAVKAVDDVVKRAGYKKQYDDSPMRVHNDPIAVRKIQKTDPKRLASVARAHQKMDAKEEVKKTYRQMMKEADFTKAQTKMAHTIGKEFEKKGVGDEDKGGPYAVASAMVRDKPEAAKKAYATIKSKMKEDQDAELLFKLYNDLNEENQQMFMEQLEEDADTLLFFAKNLMED